MIKDRILRVDAVGDAYTVGHALGRACADSIPARVFPTEEFQALDQLWRGSDYLKSLEAAARATYPQYVREIEGMAAGAGQNFETIFMWNCRGDLQLPDNMSKSAAEVAASGCTTIQIPATETSPATIAHNEDGSPQFLGHCLWVRVEPDGEPAYDSFMYPGMLPGHTFGVNAAGLVQTINNIRAHDLKPGIPRQIVARAILACPSLASAVEVLERRDRASGFHHNIGQSGSKRLVSAEAPASGCILREVDAPIAHANHLLADEFRALGQMITESSRIRQQRADQLIGDGALARGGAAEDILFDREAPIYGANDDRDDYAQTLATGVFDLYRDRVEWRVHTGQESNSKLSGTAGV